MIVEPWSDNITLEDRRGRRNDRDNKVGDLEWFFLVDNKNWEKLE